MLDQEFMLSAAHTKRERPEDGLAHRRAICGFRPYGWLLAETSGSGAPYAHCGPWPTRWKCTDRNGDAKIEGTIAGLKDDHYRRPKPDRDKDSADLHTTRFCDRGDAG